MQDGSCMMNLSMVTQQLSEVVVCVHFVFGGQVNVFSPWADHNYYDMLLPLSVSKQNCASWPLTGKEWDRHTTLSSVLIQL